MKHKSIVLFCSALLYVAAVISHADDVLPSWKDGLSRQAIIEFVERVNKEGGTQYVPPAQRIAVFDNDGTLWSEQPLYFQLAFALDRIKALAPEHPEWKTRQPFKAALEGDRKTLMAGGKEALLELIMASHAGNTTEEFSQIVKDWIATARHPDSGRPYTDMVYLPMLELLDYLRTNGFKTYIVSGGGIEFMRPWSEEIYGIPPEQVIGSSIKTTYELRDGVPLLVRLPEMNFVDDKSGKPVAINQHIGRRSIAAFGNSDGDLEMLQWVCDGGEGNLCVYVHHTDAKREWAYDRDSHIGRLDKGLDQAKEKDWTIVDMKRDWQAIYPVQQ